MVHMLSPEWLATAAATGPKRGGSGSGSSCITVAAYSRAVETHTMLHILQITLHTVHKGEREPLACLVTLLLNRDARGRRRERLGKGWGGEGGEGECERST